MKKPIVKVTYSTQLAYDDINDALALVALLNKGVMVDDTYLNLEKVYRETNKELDLQLTWKQVYPDNEFRAISLPDVIIPEEIAAEVPALAEAA